MKRSARTILSICFLLIYSLCISAADSYYFFSEEDRAAIRQSAQAGWGQSIISGLKDAVKDRRSHSMAVPLLEGGHLHDYFCPVHNLSFSFDWDRPSSHYCAECAKYWEGNKRYDWAWVNKVHAANLAYLEACTYLYLATGDRTYAEYIRDMLLDYASKYPTFFEHNTNRTYTELNSGKLFGQSLDESVWASDACRAYGVAKEIMTEKQISDIENGYLRPCASLLLKRRGGGNWQVWHNSGLIALGVALQDDKLIDVALNDTQCGYHRLMEVHVHNDGWWNEGSPIYHYYPLRAMLLSAEALRCRGINLYDAKLYNMLASPALGVYADLTFPAHNDGWYGESLLAQVKLYEIALKRFEDPLFKTILERCYARKRRDSVEALFNSDSISIGTPSHWGKSLCFKDLGVGILRSKDKTVVLKYGPYGGGHGHPDKLSISIHDGESEVLTDMGTSAYGVPDFTGWYRKTLSHSTVTVDAKDQIPSAGNLVSFAPTMKGGKINAEANEAYKGVKMARALELNGNKLTDLYTCLSDTAHQYDYVLMFTERPQLTGQAVKGGLDDAPVYNRIKDIQRFTPDRSFVCKVGNRKVNIELLDAASYEVFVGTSVGIPPTNPGVKTEEQTEKRAALPCYPLIIRVKGQAMKIKASWNFDN